MRQAAVARTAPENRSAAAVSTPSRAGRTTPPRASSPKARGATATAGSRFRPAWIPRCSCSRTVARIGSTRHAQAGATRARLHGSAPGADRSRSIRVAGGVLRPGPGRPLSTGRTAGTRVAAVRAAGLVGPQRSARQLSRLRGHDRRQRYSRRPDVSCRWRTDPRARRSRLRPSRLRRSRGARRRAAGDRRRRNRQCQAGGGSAQTCEASRVLPDRPYDLEKLRSLDADVQLRASKVESKKLPIDSLHAHVTLESGVLRVRPLDVGLAGGIVHGDITLDARRDVIAAVADVRASGVELPQLFPNLKATSVGLIGGEATIEGRGNSVAQMLATADGEVATVMGTGRGQQPAARTCRTRHRRVTEVPARQGQLGAATLRVRRLRGRRRRRAHTFHGIRHDRHGDPRQGIDEPAQ